MPTLLDYFQMEAVERLERLSSGLLALERSANDETLARDLFREVHSLKGAAGVSGLPDVSEICHKMEDLLGEIREDAARATSATIDALLHATDAVQKLIEARVKGHSCDVSKAAVIEELDKTGGGAPPKEGAKPLTPSAAVKDGPATTLEAVKGERPDPVANQERACAGETAPTKDAAKPEPTSEAVKDKQPDAHRERACNEKEGARPLTTSAAVKGEHDSRTSGNPNENDSHAAGASPIETVRIGVDMLESLANLTGELMVAGDRLRRRLDSVSELRSIVRSEGNRHHDNPAVTEMLRSITSAVHRITDDFTGDVAVVNPLISEIHEQVLATRMLPISTLFDRLERFVRDYCRQENKQAELHIEGADTQVDRQVLEQLRDPMIHLIRNAVSHGIESPHERERVGKKPVGTIRLTSSRRGDRIRITCEDDGHGLNHQRILAKAISSGVVTQAEAADLTIKQIEALILRPGFSTAELITDVSGRGVGMDVVAYRMQTLGGVLDIESQPGKFSRFILEFPASVATLEGFLVEAAGFTYVVPISSVVSTTAIKLSSVRTIGGKAMANIDGQAVPLLMLDEMLGCAAREKTPRNAILSVVVRYGGDEIAIGVDRILGSQTVVAKNLGNLVHEVRGVIGATILGTGLPAIIIDLGRLARDYSAGSAGSLHCSQSVVAAAPAKAEPSRILVVDDSITTRTMERSILESAGYIVDCAVSAEDALVKIVTTAYRLFVVDVEMPGMNGFQLTRKLRQDERYSQIPIIIVTSLAKDEHRREGLDAGANAYIVKGEFDQNNLIDTVERLIGK